MYFPFRCLFFLTPLALKSYFPGALSTFPCCVCRAEVATMSPDIAHQLCQQVQGNSFSLLPPCACLAIKPWQAIFCLPSCIVFSSPVEGGLERITLLALQQSMFLIQIQSKYAYIEDGWQSHGPSRHPLHQNTTSFDSCWVQSPKSAHHNSHTAHAFHGFLNLSSPRTGGDDWFVSQHGRMGIKE